MNLIEAIKSGRPFRRQNGLGHVKRWCVARDCVQTVDEDSVFLDREDLTADDWEVQEPEVTITATAYEAAVDKTCAEVSEDEWGDGRFCAALKKNLGLGVRWI